MVENKTYNNGVRESETKKSVMREEGLVKMKYLYGLRGSEMKL